LSAPFRVERANPARAQPDLGGGQRDVIDGDRHVDRIAGLPAGHENRLWLPTPLLLMQQ
jgi:hypothetical protein